MTAYYSLLHKITQLSTHASSKPCNPSQLLLLHRFNSLFSRTIWVSRNQKGKTSLDLNEARDGGVFGMAVVLAGLYANNLHLTADRYPHQTPHHSIFTGWALFLTPNSVKALNKLHTHTHTRLTALCPGLPG